jgi:hypothetical protein
VTAVTDTSGTGERAWLLQGYFEAAAESSNFFLVNVPIFSISVQRVELRRARKCRFSWVAEIYQVIAPILTLPPCSMECGSHY